MRFGIVLSVFFLLLIISPAKATDEKPSTVSNINVTVARARLKSISQVIDDVGKVYAVDSAVLSFSVDEKIDVINFDGGEDVQKGQVIAELSHGVAKADVAKAQSEFNLAKNKWQRSMAMIKKEPNSISLQDIDELKENVNLAQAEFDQKKAILDNYQIVAPFNGRLTDFSQSAGSYIKAFDPLVTIFKLNPVDVFYSVSQDNLDKIALNQKVELSAEALTNTKFSGVVNYIAPDVSIKSGRVNVHARVDNHDLKLFPGMFVNVKHYLDSKKRYLLVPQKSINAKDKQRFVWLVNADNTISQRQVKLGKNLNSGDVIVEKGLKEGDQVVTTGNQWLADGMTVEVNRQSPK